MVDLERGYRRWRFHRLAALLPVFLAALATQILVAMDRGASDWFRVLSLGISGLILVLVGVLVGQVLLVTRPRAGRDRAAGRLLRGQIDASRRSAPVAAFLLVVLNVAPFLAPADPGPRPLPPLPSLVRLPRMDPVPPPAPEPEPAVIGPEQPAPHPDRAPVPELLNGLPVSIAADSDAPMPASFPPGQDSPPDGTTGDGDGFPRFRPGVDDPFGLDLDLRVVLSLDRLGAPRDGEMPPPELRLDVSLLEGSGRGSELSLAVDVPIGPDESVRTTIALGRVSDGENYLSEGPQAAWDRVTIAYQRRVVGYSRQAPFDLAVSIGVTLEHFDRAGIASTGVSPYIGIDTALWQHGPAGLLVHAGYAVPVDLGGASSGLVDVSASVRIDLTETLSIQAGYRYLLHRRDPDTDAGPAAGIEEGDQYTGPVLGITFRF